MDSGATLFHSCHLVGLPPSTSTPPLGERHRQSRWTNSHIDSHTIGDHEDEIPELSYPPQEVGEEDTTPMYDPSPDIPTHSRFDPSHDIPTHSRYDPSFTSHVRTASTRVIVSQSQVPPVVSGGHIPTFGTSYGLLQGVPHIPTYGFSHGTSHGTSHGASHGQYYGP